MPRRNNIPWSVRLRYRLFRKLWPAIVRLFGFLITLTGRALILPVDCLFCLYDIVAVNLRKSPLTGGHCRPSRRQCPRARKYTNKWLFRTFVCPRAIGRPDIPALSCKAGPRESLHPVRALVFLALLLGAATALLGGLLVLRPGAIGRSTSTAPPPRSAAEPLRRGRRAFGAARFDEALEHFRTALTISPHLAEPAYRMGRCLEELGDSTRARRYYRRAARGENGVPEAALRLTDSLYEAGRFSLAGRYARRALQLGADTPRAHAILAQMHILDGQTSEGRKHLNRAMELDGDSPVVLAARALLLLRQGSNQQARRLMTDPNAGGDLFVWQLCRAQVLCLDGKFQQAERLLDDLARRYPDSMAVHLWHLETLLSTGRREEARSLARRIRRDFSPDPPLALRLARTLHHHREDDLALHIARPLARQPGDSSSDARLLTARIFLRKNLPTCAEDLVATVLEEDPHHTDANLLAGRIALARGKPEEARRIFGETLTRSTGSADAHYLMGLASHRADHLEEAVEHLAKAAQRRPENGRFHYRHASALLAAGRTEEALAPLQSAAEHLPNPYEAYTRLGTLAFQREDHQQAVEWYRKAVQAAPDRAAVAYNNLAHMMLQNGKSRPLALALAHTARAIGGGRWEGETTDTFADALIKTGYPALALDAARRAAKARPEEAPRLVRLGIAEHAAGNPERALEALQKASELTRDETTRQNLAKILRKLRNGNPKEEANNEE